MSESDGREGNGPDGSAGAEAGDVWAEASTEQTGRDDAGRRGSGADPAGIMDSVEGIVNDFFRGASFGRAAAGFGRAAGRTARSASGGGRDVWADATAAGAGGRDASAECRYCPFCQTLAAVRGARPELTDQISETAKTLLDLVRQAAEQTRGGRGKR